MATDPTTFGALKASAAAELAQQIDQLSPNASALAAQGFSWLLAVHLVEVIGSGQPDIQALRAFGLDAKAAVSICTAIAGRHTEVKTRLAALPAPAPPRSVLVAPDVAIRALPVEPAPVVVEDPDAIDQFSAMSALHTLSVCIQRERACPTELAWAGFTASTAEELARLVNATRSFR